MSKCEICGAVFPDSWPQPIHCTHSQPGKDFRRSTEASIGRESRLNPWQLIHSRLARYLDSSLKWNATEQVHWYESNFVPIIPSNDCGCEDHWTPIAKKLDWSTAESAFRSFWAAHNEVSIKHAGHPAIPYDQCRALYLPQPSMDDCCVAVTSLAPDRLERQTVCLDSWEMAGLSIHAVQSATEIEQLKPIYPQVSQWRSSDDVGPPRIKRMASIAYLLGQTILLINADVEIRGEQRLIREAIAGGVLVGVRHNYDSVWWQGKVEKWGVDAFSFTPEAASRLLDLDFRIGRPVWDYWILDYFKSSQMNWICEPLFFHKTHELGWSDEDFKAGFEKLQQSGSTIDQPYGAVFRKSFPYPPVNK